MAALKLDSAHLTHAISIFDKDYLLEVISSQETARQNSVFPGGGAVNNICLTTAPWSQNYLLPLAASSLPSASGARGPSTSAFADHLGTCFTRPRGTASPQHRHHVQNVQTSLHRRSHSPWEHSSLWRVPHVEQLPAASTEATTVTSFCRGQTFCFQVTSASYSETGFQRWNVSITWQSLRYQATFFFLLTDCCSAESSRRWNWAVRNLTAAKQSLRRAGKIFLHQLSPQTHSYFFFTVWSRGECNSKDFH